jgi:AcrR family transcriptional regulator
MADVKDGGGRRAEKAQQTRRRMLDAARDLFLTKGYGATTLQDVAAQAGVAVQTLYFTFGNKRALLKEVVDVAIAGDLDPVPTLERPWFRAVLDAPTADELVRRHVTGSRAVLDRVALITAMLASAAATDPAVRDLWPGDVDPRLVVHRSAAEALLTKPWTRAGLTPDRATDALYGLLSPELYLLLVRQRGWTPAAWQEWTTSLLLSELCA